MATYTVEPAQHVAEADLGRRAGRGHDDEVKYADQPYQQGVEEVRHGHDLRVDEGADARVEIARSHVCVTH